jgi:hypothetical protein
MKVERITEGFSSWIEPPLDPRWSEEVKLQWQAAVVSHDTGLKIEIQREASRFKPARYSFTVQAAHRSLSGFGGYTYHQAWEALAVFGQGATAVLAAVRAYADELAEDARLSYLAAGESPPRQLDYSEGHYAGCVKTREEIARELRERFSPST